MSSGLHGAHGLSPEVSYQIYKIYVIPRLLYGLKILSLNKTQLDKINRYHLTYFILLLSIPTYAVTPGRACWFKCVINREFIKS